MPRLADMTTISHHTVGVFYGISSSINSRKVFTPFSSDDARPGLHVCVRTHDRDVTRGHAAHRS
jgi:hypothetical protein